MARKQSNDVVPSDESKEIKMNENNQAGGEVVDVSHMVEVAAPPTFEQSLAKLNEQLADEALFPMVKDALIKVRSQIVTQRIRELRKEILTLHAMLPVRTRKAKA